MGDARSLFALTSKFAPLGVFAALAGRVAV